jgi:hypothetical protein
MNREEQIQYSKNLVSKELILLYGTAIQDLYAYQEMNDDNINPLRLFIENEIEKCDLISENEKYYSLTVIDSLILHLIELIEDERKIQ